MFLLPGRTMRVFRLLCVLCGCFPLISALGPAEIKGYKFFDGDRELTIRGIDYYPRPNKGDLNHNSLDLFTASHRHIWERDIPYLRELGVNAVRLYAVDASEDHDAFMCAMEAAGIYVVVALAHDCPTCAVTMEQAPDCYPPELKIQGQQVIHAFAKYSNTLAFSAGNEVNHFAPPDSPEWNAPCQKKFLRDMREYIDSCSIRNVPIGLISADNDREDLARYYNCREDDADVYQQAEWYGLNSYVLCDGATKEYKDALGLQLLEKSFEALNYSIPVLLTEFGCLSDTFPTINGYPGQRTFHEGAWLVTEPALREHFSGGFAFEYSIEMENAKSESPYPFNTFGKQNYGIGYLGPETCNDVDIPCTYHPLPSFEELRTAFRASDGSDAIYKDDFTIPPSRTGKSSCPEQFPPLDSFIWEADTVKDIDCPRRRREKDFVCPSNYKDLFRERRENVPPRMAATAFGALGTLMTAVVVYLIVRWKRDSIPSVLTIHSDESAGLLSMRGVRGGSYEAIESDSSSNGQDS